jgi:hypothetical protein
MSDEEDDEFRSLFLGITEREILNGVTSAEVLVRNGLGSLADSILPARITSVKTRQTPPLRCFESATIVRSAARFCRQTCVNRQRCISTSQAVARLVLESGYIPSVCHTARFRIDSGGFRGSGAVEQLKRKLLEGDSLFNSSLKRSSTGRFMNLLLHR